MTVETGDPLHWRHALRAGGLLHSFNTAGVLEAADVHVADRFTALSGETDERIALALALAVRALRTGSVCVDITSVAVDLTAAAENSDEVGTLPWPDPAQWIEQIASSTLLAEPAVIRLDDGRLLYLDRYWREEQQVCDDLCARLGTDVPPHPDALTAGLHRVFYRGGSDEQRDAARLAVSQRTTVLTGGPGTGKTSTVAGLLALLTEQSELAGVPRPRIALAAPTGKAAARLTEAVRVEIGHLPAADQARLAGLQAVTLHRLLGARPDTAARFRHHRGNRLPHDVIIVDETSMVSLTMMARLLEALRPETRLILVGDPDQLASVDAGAVLADLCAGLGRRSDTRIAQLSVSHRFGASIGLLAEAIRAGDADTALDLLSAGDGHIEFVDTADPTARLRDVVVPQALRLRAAAADGDADTVLTVLDEHRLLCAHRDGARGVRYWNRQTQRWLSDVTGEPLWSEWYVGRPVLVTANDYGLGLYNGDTGVTMLAGGVLRVVIAGAGGPVQFATSRLADVETMHAMTIHKSQGSQADEVTVLMPPQESRLLSRELFYTAVTRAKKKVRIVGSAQEVRAALGRRVIRATGLQQRLARG